MQAMSGAEAGTRARPVAPSAIRAGFPGWIVLILATAALRLAFGWALGLGIDESYMVASGRELQFGYFDHPPLAWWLAWAAARGVLLFVKEQHFRRARSAVAYFVLFFFLSKERKRRRTRQGA
jgi:hypothetical protein